MRAAITCALSLGLAGAAVVTVTHATGQPPAAKQPPSPDSQYRLGPDSQPQEGVPKGEIKGPFTLPCAVYPGTQHTYWVYVPAQYDPKIPAALMVFNDGQAFKNEKGDLRAQYVMDNLIYRREIPVMIGVFINPGRRPDQPEPTPQNWGDRDTNRPTEYNSLDDKYPRVITEELLPALAKDYNISKDPEMQGHRRVEFGSDRRVHRRVGEAGPLPQGALEHRQLCEPAGRARLRRTKSWRPRRNRSGSTSATGEMTTAG